MKRKFQQKYCFFSFTGPETYAFGYEIKSPLNNNVQFREEEKLGDGTVHGSHGYIRPDGYVTITHYTADKSGYHSTVENFIDPDFSSSFSITTTDVNLMDETRTSSQSFTHTESTSSSTEEGLKSLHPKIATVINGEVSLTSKNTDNEGARKIGFLIPDNFHLSTFELPTNKTN